MPDLPRQPDRLWIEAWSGRVAIGLLAFTLQGARLGHGAGYYDEYLWRHEQMHNTRPYTIALSLKEQIVAAVPISNHDHVADVVCVAE